MPNFVMDGTGLICALQGRTFEKVNPGRAIVGIYANGGGYAGPLLIAETADAVTFWTSNGGTHPYAKTIQHKGVTYYVSKDAEFMPEGAVDTSGLDRYRCSAAGLAAAAEELLNAYEHSNIPTAGQLADYTGAVYNRTGKLYHFDGGAFSQIGKVYGYDGTAMHLIYSAEEWMLKGGKAADVALVTYRNNGADSSYNEAQGTDHLALSTSTTAGWRYPVNRKFSSSKINLTGVDRITVECSLWHAWGSNAKSYAGVQVGISNAQEWATVAKVEVANQTGARTVTLDVSGYSGEYYVFFGVFAGVDADNGSASTEAAFYNVCLT